MLLKYPTEQSCVHSGNIRIQGVMERKQESNWMKKTQN